MARMIPHRNLLLSFAQQRYLRSASFPSPPSPSPPSFTVRFLMRSCGFSSETAVSASQNNPRLRQKDSQEHESVVDFLKTHGLSDPQIAKLVAKRPAILRSQLEIHRPKFEYLAQIGFVGPLLAEVVSNSPQIWKSSLRSQIKPAINVLKQHLQTDEDVILAVRRSTMLLTAHPKAMQRNIDFLIREGVPIATVSKMIVSNPRVILHSPDRVANVLNAIKPLGLHPESLAFARLFQVRISLSDSTFERKVGFLKSLGWSEEDIASTLKCLPICLSYSENKIKGAMDYFVNTMKLEPRFLISCPTLLAYSIDKRVRPRYELLKLLEARGLLELSNKILYLPVQPEQKFLKNYVNKYLDQVPNLLELYLSSSTAGG